MNQMYWKMQIEPRRHKGFGFYIALSVYDQYVDCWEADNDMELMGMIAELEEYAVALISLTNLEEISA